MPLSNGNDCQFDPKQFVVLSIGYLNYTLTGPPYILVLDILLFYQHHKL